MHRCNKCLMPDTLAGSNFDENGVCSWCRDNYPPYRIKGEKMLGNKFRGLGEHKGSAACLVGLTWLMQFKTNWKKLYWHW